MATSKSLPSVRERLLDAANELFYAEGVHTVGIDRVLARAGVAKASLYGTFGSKEELVRAYLVRRGQMRRDRITARLEVTDGPRARLMSVFDVLAEAAAEPNYRGCAFASACSEGPHGPSPIREATADQRAWVRDLFTTLATDAGAHEAPSLARELALLYDGAMMGASLDSDPTAALVARRIAARLLDVSLAERPSGSSGSGRSKSSAKRARIRAAE